MLAFREKQFHCTINVGRKGSDVVFEKIAFRVHAIQRMYERSITAEEVHTVIQTGETIEDYPNDFPYPSRLLLGWCGTERLLKSAEEAARSGIQVEIRQYTAA